MSDPRIVVDEFPDLIEAGRAGRGTRQAPSKRATLADWANLPRRRLIFRPIDRLPVNKSLIWQLSARHSWPNVSSVVF